MVGWYKCREDSVMSSFLLFSDLSSWRAESSRESLGKLLHPIKVFLVVNYMYIGIA